MKLTRDLEAWYQYEYGISAQKLREGFIPAAEVRWALTYSPIDGHHDFADDLSGWEETQDMTDDVLCSRYHCKKSDLRQGETLFVNPEGRWFCMNDRTGDCRWYESQQ
jgi:hypothetical protein